MSNLTYTTGILPTFPPTRSAGHPMSDAAKAMLDTLQATLGTEPQTVVIVAVESADDKAMSKVQTRLNGLGRRGGFGVATRRDPSGQFNNGVAAVFAWAVPKRPSKPRGSRK